jgi:hypothetical protein
MRFAPRASSLEPRAVWLPGRSSQLVARSCALTRFIKLVDKV